jgi:serine/threonine-protein kinase
MRLLAGQTRDPAVGTDLLLGILAGVIWVVAARASDLAPGWMGKLPSAPTAQLAHGSLLGLRGIASVLLVDLGGCAFLALAYFFVFFLLRLLLRRKWLAVVVTLLLASVPWSFREHPVLNVAYSLAYYGIALLHLIRFGLLALMVALCMFSILFAFPLTVNLSAWHAGPTISLLTAIPAVAIFGF